MLTESDLILLDGWVREIYLSPSPAVVTKSGWTTLFDLEYVGFLESAIFISNDSSVTLSLHLSESQISVNIKEIYNYGIPKYNPSLAYIGTYQPTNGTAGTYSVLLTPAELIPIKRRMSMQAILNQDSTQNVAYVTTYLIYYLIYDMDAFKKSFKEFFSQILPKEANKYQPISTTPVIHASESNKYNPFEYIP